MDEITVKQYNEHASQYSNEYDTFLPENLYKLIKVFFKENGLTADIGCGNGRDASYIKSLGGAVKGYDASSSMVKEARERYGNSIEFLETSLPDLENLKDNEFDNVLCSAVLMHLPDEEVIHACRNLMRIIKDEGIIIVSTRSGRNESEREDDGRLFTPIPPDRLVLLFEGFGGSLIYRTTDKDGSRPDIEWTTLVIKKKSKKSDSGILSVQQILTDEQKTATYKFALMRAICEISQNEPEMCKWDSNGKFVWVPVSRVAVRWLRYYWKFIKEPVFNSLKQSSSSSLAMATHINKVKLKAAELPTHIDDLSDKKVITDVNECLKNIENTIINMPVKYAGAGEYGLFDKPANCPLNIKRKGERFFGVPVLLWRDISLFAHWIQESISVRWAEQIVRFTCKDNDSKTDEIFSLAMKALRMAEYDERSTTEIRDFLINNNIQEKCLWSLKIEKDFDVDHLLPYSVLGNNDLWNLLPAGKSQNREKSDRIPSPDKLEKNKDVIIYYWKKYNESFQERFASQVYRFFGTDTEKSNWETKTYKNLEVQCERLVNLRGLNVWE